MTGIEIVLLIVSWIIGTFVSLVFLYYANDRITLANLIASILFWWLIVPGMILVFLAMGLVWLCSNADDIVLLERDHWWLSKGEREKLKEEKNKEKKGKGLTLNNILKK
jgi:hypothetical protein